MGVDDIPPPGSHLQHQRSGERRHLTVLFCDLLGSTEVSTALDPEELSEVLHLYQAHVAQVIGTYGGTIAQYLGDGVLAYFGYPQAHENDAECAIRASLDIVGKLPVLANSPFQLKVRIGIATGLVVVGQVREATTKGEPLAIGETPNLAARLQAAAPANGILIAESTRRLVGHLFNLADPVLLQVKGVNAPVSAYEVRGVSTIESRFEALRTEATPFIGREEELALITRRWTQARGGDGRAVLFSGEAGIGKSRILDRACKDIDGDACAVRLYCSPLHTKTALFPFLSYLRKAADLQDGDSDAEKLAKLAAFLAPAFPAAEAAAEDFSGVLGIAPQSERQAALTPARRKEIAIKALLDYPQALCRHNPVLIVLEDAHWLDPTSIELLDRLVSAIGDQRILLVVSARPEYQPVWASHPSVTLVSLSRFGWREGAAIISGVARGKALPPELTEQILERSDGVPLFLEELTKTLLDSGVLAESAGGYRLQGLLPKVALPDTLQDSLTARLDGLGPVKALAQVGAAIGREFSHELLLAVSGMGEDAMTEALGKLLASGLIYRRGTPPDAIYFFKHALIQDAAYDTLLRSRRQQLHATVAQAILGTFPAIAASQPEVIAHHLTAAEDYARAIQFWLLAGKAQIRASADLEAIDHLKRGISLLCHVADETQRQQTELALQTALIGPLVAVKGPFSPEVAACCERGLALSTTGGIAPTVFPFMYGQFTYSISTGKVRHAAEIGRRFIAIAEAAGYPSGVVVGHRILGLALLALGEFQEARRALEKALALYSPERDDNVTFLFGQNVKVNSQTVLSLALCCLGEEEASLSIARECLHTAQQLKHPHTTAISISYAGVLVSYLRDDFDEMQRQAERMVAISTEFGLQLFATIGHFYVGLASYWAGHVEAGFAQMEAALAVFDRAGYKLGVASYLCMLARAKAAAGLVPEARALAARSRALMEESEECWCAAEILCTEAEIAARSDPPDVERARGFIDQAILRATELRAHGLEARARRVHDRLFAGGLAVTP
jgi:class 3 adenylate cyclase/tetratricopeptide (TPR) repeat protein